MSNLKPCPFCGYEAEYWIMRYPGTASHRSGENVKLSTFVVRCKRCKAMSPGGIFIDNGELPYEELEVAERNWNRRVSNT